MCDIEFDRWAVCNAYYMYSVLWGGDGERYANEIGNRLHRLRYRPARSEETFDGMTEEAKFIYGRVVMRHNRDFIAYCRLHKRRPDLFPAWPGTQSFPRTPRYRVYADWVRSLGFDPKILEVWGAA